MAEETTPNTKRGMGYVNKHLVERPYALFFNSNSTRLYTLHGQPCSHVSIPFDREILEPVAIFTRS